jgi:hypothetical protein
MHISKTFIISINMNVNCIRTEEHSWQFAVSLVLIRSETMYFRDLLKMIVVLNLSIALEKKPFSVVRWAELETIVYPS